MGDGQLHHYKLFHLNDYAPVQLGVLHICEAMADEMAIETQIDYEVSGKMHCGYGI